MSLQDRLGPALNQHLARRTLAAFVLTFIGARLLALLIMTRAIPDLFVYIGGTHVHHLNLGIFLLAGVAAWLLFDRPEGHRRSTAALLYGIGLALTFDEFGMWLHLGGSYWQRASFDAVMVVGGLLALLTVAPSWRRFRPRHWATAIALLLATILFAWLLVGSLGEVGEAIGPRLRRIEAGGPH
jgi:hypothetical protein